MKNERNNLKRFELQKGNVFLRINRSMNEGILYVECLRLARELYRYPKDAIVEYCKNTIELQTDPFYTIGEQKTPFSDLEGIKALFKNTKQVNITVCDEKFSIKELEKWIIEEVFDEKTTKTNYEKIINMSLPKTAKSRIHSYLPFGCAKLEYFGDFKDKDVHSFVKALDLEIKWLNEIAEN